MYFLEFLLPILEAQISLLRLFDSIEFPIEVTAYLKRFSECALSKFGYDLKVGSESVSFHGMGLDDHLHLALRVTLFRKDKQSGDVRVYVDLIAPLASR